VTWKLLKPSAKEYQLAMRRSVGQCVTCGVGATEVVLRGMSSAAFCRKCRVVSVGWSASERSSGAAKRQQAMFEEERRK
jgi:hypothetical protein